MTASSGVQNWTTGRRVHRPPPIGGTELDALRSRGRGLHWRVRPLLARPRLDGEGGAETGRCLHLDPRVSPPRAPSKNGFSGKWPLGPRRHGLCAVFYPPGNGRSWADPMQTRVPPRRGSHGKKAPSRHQRPAEVVRRLSDAESPTAVPGAIRGTRKGTRGHHAHHHAK